jgi:hypothetical protein
MDNQPDNNPTDPSAVDNGSYTVASLPQKIFLATMLILTAVALTVVWLSYIKQVDKMLHKETRVSWVASTNVILASGPPTFYVDRQNKQLVFVGQIDKETKRELIGLFDVGDKKTKKFLPSYLIALDQLAYNSNDVLRDVSMLILMVGGISGVMGVHLRSMINFIGIACFQDKLDVARWWPWYLVRPVYGFILGVLVVVLVRTGALSAGAADSADTLSWVAVAVLAGFGADEFTQRLRLLSQALFGKSK